MPVPIIKDRKNVSQMMVRPKKGQIGKAQVVFAQRKGSLTPIKQFTASKESLSVNNIKASQNSKSNVTTIYNETHLMNL